MRYNVSSAHRALLLATSSTGNPDNSSADEPNDFKSYGFYEEHRSILRKYNDDDRVAQRQFGVRSGFQQKPPVSDLCFKYSINFTNFYVHCS